MKCPQCQYEWKLPGPQAGGRKGGKKGFAVAGQPSAAARKRGWQKRKALAKRSPNAEGESRAASARTLHPLVGHSDSGGGRE